MATGEMDHWAGKVGTEFTSAGFRLRLAGVQAFASPGVRPADVTRDRAFLAVFDVLSGGQMPGDLIYALASAGIAPLDVFVNSSVSREYPNRMSAVFN